MDTTMKAVGRLGQFSLPVEIDANGRARKIKAIDGSAPRGGAIPNAPETESGGGGSGGRTIVKSAFDSKLEAKRDRHLSMLVLAGEVKQFRYHPFMVPIGPKRNYTPDFLVEYQDGRIVIEEVKGSLKMKNARDSVTRLHVAAGLLPMFSWRLVIGKAMEERVVA